MLNIRALLNLTYYTSELDQFLIHFDKTHPNPTPSQAAEIKKYQRIFKLRDGNTVTDPAQTLWDKF